MANTASTIRGIQVIAGRSYSVRECNHCNGTGKVYDATESDKVDPGPYAGRCSSCLNGEKLTLMPEIELAEALAHEHQRAILARESQVIGDMPDWMC